MHDTGTTKGVIAGRLMTFLDAMDLAKTGTFDLVSLNSSAPESPVGGMIEVGPWSELRASLKCWTWVLARLKSLLRPR